MIDEGIGDSFRAEKCGDVYFRMEDRWGGGRKREKCLAALCRYGEDDTTMIIFLGDVFTFFFPGRIE